MQRNKKKRLALESHLSTKIHSVCKNLCDTLGFNIDSVYLEYPLTQIIGGNARTVDILCITDSHEVIIIEIQLGISDDKHYDQFDYIIENTSCGHLVWIAEEFSDELVQKLKDRIRSSGKSFSLTLVKVSDSLISEIADLRSLHCIMVKGALIDITLKDDDLKVVDKLYSIVNPKETSILAIPPLEISLQEYIHIMILSMLRKESDDIIFNRYRYDLSKSKLRFGGGRDGIDFYYSCSEEPGKTFVEYKFAYGKEFIFNELLAKKTILETLIGEPIDFNVAKNTLRISCCGENSIDSKINWIVSTIIKLRRYTINYVSYLGKKNQSEMFRKHPAGIL